MPFYTPHKSTIMICTPLWRDRQEYNPCNQRSQAGYLVSRLSRIPGLNVISPGGAMYMMVRNIILSSKKVGFEKAQFKDFADDIEFSKKLLAEEMVFVLPGK